MTRLFSLFALLLLLASCGKEEQKQPRDTEELPQITMDKSPRPVLPPKPKVRLQDYQFKDLPGWKNDNLLEALDSFKLSCAKIMQEKNTYLSNSELHIPRAAYHIPCQSLFADDIPTAEEFKYYLERNIQPFLVIAVASDQGKFTSYYDSSIHA